MVALVQDSIQLNVWICSCMNVNCIILGIITWLLFSCKDMKIQVCVNLRRDGSWLLFWVFNLRSKRKSLDPGIMLHDFCPRVQETEPCRSLSSRLIYWASSRIAKLRQWSFWKIESEWQCNGRGHVSATSSGRTQQLCRYGSGFRSKNRRDWLVRQLMLDGCSSRNRGDGEEISITEVKYSG